MDLLTNYFNFAESRDKIQLKYKVTHRESIILRMITSAYNESHELTVSDTIQQKSIASPATSHASLKSLIENKLIEFTKQDNPIENSTTINARCYLAPDSEVRILRQMTPNT